MKKLSLTIISIVLFAFIAASCSNPPVVILPPIDHSTPYDVDSADDFTAMLESTGQARLTSDLIVPSIAIAAGESKSIDLNDHNLVIDTTDASSRVVLNGSSLSISNGNLILNLEYAGADESTTALRLDDGASLTIRNATITSDTTTTAIFGSNSSIVIENSTINSNGGYAVGTNAADGDTGTTMIIRNSTLTSNSVGVLFNIGGTLEISDSTITAKNQAVIARAGTATITNSVLSSTGPYDSTYEEYVTNDWKDGNKVPFAALVVGDRSNSSYNHGPVSCTVKNTTINMAATDTKAFRIYLASDDGIADSSGDVEYTSTSLSIDNSTYASEITGKESFYKGTDTTVTLNGTPLSNEP